MPHALECRPTAAKVKKICLTAKFFGKVKMKCDMQTIMAEKQQDKRQLGTKQIKGTRGCQQWKSKGMARRKNNCIFIRNDTIHRVHFNFYTPIKAHRAMQDEISDIKRKTLIIRALKL